MVDLKVSWRVVMLSDCPRCESLLRFGSDMYGKFYSCIQCGYYKDITPVVVVPNNLKGHFKPGRYNVGLGRKVG